MDRISQHSSQRSQETGHAQKLGQRNAPAPFPSFLPPTAQPPIQIPFADPFQNRDPFLPASQHHRRGSFGNMNGAPLGQYSGERAWHGLQGQQQPPHTTHQPPPHGFNGQPHMSIPLDSARRRSLGGPGSPPQYIGGPLEPPPPPTSTFSARNMPPPSPPSMPPQSSSFAGSAPRGPSAASPFSGVRDFSGFASRSGGGMSISSLIGGDSSSQVDRSPRANTTAPSPVNKSIRSYSPQRARSASNRAEYASMRRPPSPARLVHGSEGERRPSTVAHDVHRGPSNHAPTASTQLHPPFAPLNTHMFRPYQSSPSSTTGEQPYVHGNQAPPRPSSQPVTTIQQDREQRARVDMQERGQFPAFRHFNEQQFRPGDSQHHEATEAPDRLSHSSHEIEARNPTPDNLRPSRFGSAHSQTGFGHPGNEAHERLVRSVHDEAHRIPTPDDALPARFGAAQGPGRTPLREEYQGLFRPAFHPPAFHQHNPNKEAVDSRVLHSLRKQDRQTSPAPADTLVFDPRSRLFGPQPHPHEGASIHEQHLRREMEDGHALHRSFLGVSPEMGRKSGRGSPLPQAVQGAQPRHIGPGGRDPSIKNEFGRMFSGLGSGVGGSSTPIAGFSANGTATPSRMSPIRYAPEAEARQSAESEPLRNGNTAGRGAKKGRKAKETVETGDSDSADERNTPTLAQRGSKRAKTSHAAHHHHHHAHAHQHHHHHHHHAAGDEPPQASGGFSTLRFPSNPAVPQQVGMAATHHHHHHHPTHPRGGHHHHHPTKRAASVPIPTITVVNRDLLDSIKDSPRSHLGSTLYKPALSLPSNKHILLDSKFAFDSTPNPIPRFENKINCTFTVRVPRAYLGSSEDTEDTTNQALGGLEEICKRRALWGTGVYTDDSDVVVAAVHDGWLRGDFGEYNEDLHELFDDTDEQKPLLSTSSLLKEKPQRPVRIPSNTDMRVTVLILPPLEAYASSTINNIHSRSWGSDHDGMSFKIHSVEFVDEPRTSRYSERTPEARRQRMKDDLRRRREAAESLMGLISGGRSVPVGA